MAHAHAYLASRSLRDPADSSCLCFCQLLESDVILTLHITDLVIAFLYAFIACFNVPIITFLQWSSDDYIGSSRVA
jgi:hypothetical protein